MDAERKTHTAPAGGTAHEIGDDQGIVMGKKIVEIAVERGAIGTGEMTPVTGRGDAATTLLTQSGGADAMTAEIEACPELRWEKLAK